MTQSLACVDIDLTTDCWIWRKATTGGYGRKWVRGRQVAAHRYVYELLVGPIPEGLDLDHLCRNRACVNPTHMEPVTRSENCRRGLAGETSARRNRAKTHCPRGHPYSVENTYIYPNGSRTCRECNRQRCLANYHRQKVLRADGKAQDEALALAEGDSVVADHKRTRDREAVLKRAAAMHVEELERNAANLRAEAHMSEGIER